MPTLPPCPDTPNCVSSLAALGSHYVEAIRYSGSPEDARKRLLNVVSNLPRTEICSSQEEPVLHVTFTSFFFRFVDDVHFLFDNDRKVIHVSSVSRTGTYDFGVNRQRVEQLRTAFTSAAE